MVLPTSSQHLPFNTRGKVVQGNNRADALKEMYSSSAYKEQQRKYIQYIIDNARSFGLTNEDIAKIKSMKNPVMVNEIDVPDFAKASNYQEARRLIELYTKQRDMLSPVTPIDIYSNFAIEMACRLQGCKMKTLQVEMKEFFNLVQGKGEGDMFGGGTSGEKLTLHDAIKRVFDVDYKPIIRDNNGEKRSDTLVGDNNESQAGGRGEPRDGGNGEPIAQGEGSAQRRAGNQGDGQDRPIAKENGTEESVDDGKQEKPSKGSKSKEKTVSSQEQGVKPSAVSPEGEKPVKERPSKELSGDSDKFQKQAKSEQDFVGRIKGMIADAANEGKSLTMADIKRAYEEERGRNSDLPSDYRDTDLQELVERAMTLATRDIAVESLSKNTPEAVRDGYDRIVQLYNSQPSLNSRDSSRMEHQQYSTPTPFAYLMDWFLRHGKTPHSGLEPSAGNGALTIGFPASIWHVNDIDERRLMNLRTMPYGKITNQDGTMPFEPKAYDMVATNPPFGTTTEKTFDGGKTKINSLEGLMAINALLSMKDDGRAAIIIGGNTSYMSNGAMQSKDMKLFRHLYTHYNVVDVINLNGDMYKRNGTGYDVRIILIDGRKTDVSDNPDKFTFPPVRDKARAEQVRTFDELYKRIEDDIQHSLSQRLQSESPDTEHRVGGESGHRDENRPEDNRQRPVSDEQPVRGRPMGGSPQPAISPADAEDGGRTGVGGEQAQISGLDNDDRRNKLGAGGVQPGEPTKERATSNRGGIGGDNRTGIPNNDNSNGGGLAVSEPQKKLNGNEDKAVGLGQEKVSYRPKSKSITFQSQVPAEQAEAIENNLDKIGDVDDFLTKELGYSSKDELFSHLSAEQIDGVALAINQMRAGKGFIIGDMTGIGKGRQGAALIRWAINQGKTPIYFTQKAKLFTDNYRDMCDIGSKGLRPFIMSSNDEAPITEIVVDKNGEVVYDDNGKVKTRVVYGIPTKQESERVYCLSE